MIGTDSQPTIHGSMSYSDTPPLSDMKAVDAYVAAEPWNLIKLLPAIMNHLEQECVESLAACNRVWNALRPLLGTVEHVYGTGSNLLKPPLCVAKRKEHINVHGDRHVDDYGWLNDREDPEVLHYIQQENLYSTQTMQDSLPLQKILYKEFISRLDESEETVRVALQDGWSYYSKKVPGKEYAVHCRCKKDMEEVVLDENELAYEEFRDASYFRVGFIKHSADGRMMAYGVDSSGNERYTARIMVLDSKEVLPDRMESVYEDFEFSNDSSCVYFTILDECERAFKLVRHTIGKEPESNRVLYHEEDEKFFLTLTKTSDSEFIILNASAQITAETRFIRADDPESPLMLLFPRRENIQNTVESHEGYFYVLTNEDAKNNWLYRIPAGSLESIESLRETVIEHRDFVLIEDFQVCKNHLIVFERSNCLQNVRIVDIRSAGFSVYHYISFSEIVYSLLPGALNEEVASMTKHSQFNTNILRFTYTSFVQPKQVIDYNMDTRIMTVVNEEKVNGIFPYDKSLYNSRRLFATGVDGTAVPISIVFRKDLLGLTMNPPQTNPVLLHSYGAYGGSTNPIFSASRLSLLDRGFVYAIAHIRGGSDMGNGWYEEGKLGKKPNTFYDFCAVAEHLIKEGYTESSKLSIYGRSAGGLLIGAVITMRPELFAAALTEVPFVDVINTMFDSSIPWTAFEYEEWGNPNDKEIYDVMKTYCPYTNIDGVKLAQNQYPNLLVVGGMNDPRVAFFEPLKWVAKMRNERHKAEQQLGIQETASEGLGWTTERLILLRIDDAGHGGNSGQYSYLEDLAFEFSFLIKSLQAPNKPIFKDMASSGYDMNLQRENRDRLRVRQATSLSQSSQTNLTDIPVESPPSASSSNRHRDARKQRRAGDEDETHRMKKGNRAKNRIVQWLNNLF